jgi:hypothetical protein
MFRKEIQGCAPDEWALLRCVFSWYAGAHRGALLRCAFSACAGARSRCPLAQIMSASSRRCGAGDSSGSRWRCRSGRGAGSARRRVPRREPGQSGDASARATAAAVLSAARGLPRSGCSHVVPRYAGPKARVRRAPAGKPGARSVVTSTGTVPTRSARAKKRRAAARSRLGDSRTSMTWPCWPAARWR